MQANESAPPEPALMTPAKISTGQYLKMIEAQVLGPADKVELHQGVIVAMSPAGSEHHACLARLNELFAPVFQDFTVWIQGTMVVGEGQVFDPDFMLLKKKDDRYRSGHPTPQDTLLVVEVAASSLPRDQQVKLPVYAKAEIPEYWIVDLGREALHMHRRPSGGRYDEVIVKEADDSVTLASCPQIEFAVRELFT